MNVTKFAWGSNFYWALGDTFGYVIANNGLTDDLVYVGYDTTYITWFSGYEVPIINGSSSSHSQEQSDISSLQQNSSCGIGLDNPSTFSLQQALPPQQDSLGLKFNNVIIKI